MHTATHPGATLDKELAQIATNATDDEAKGELFAALDAEAEEENDEPTEQKE